jgi:two-component system response regulator TctD
MHLLLIEDNKDLAEWLRRILVKSRYVVDCVYDGEEADAALISLSFDLVILDLALPGIAGIDLLKRFRARNTSVPIIILTANDAMSSRVAGLDYGADDYLVKPFDPQELEARIRAQLRRRGRVIGTRASFGALALETATRQFTLAGADLDITAREHAVLEMLVLAAGRVVSKRQITESAFGLNEDATDNAVEICIHRLRKKLEGSGVGVATLRGLGYALRKQDV